MNLDETAIQREYQSRKGFFLDISVETKVAAQCFFQPLKMASTRAQSTLVARVARLGAVQPFLRQFLIPKQSVTTQQEYALIDALPHPLVIIRESNGWVNVEIMKSIITKLRAAIRRWNMNGKLILLMDAASQHISDLVGWLAGLVGCVGWLANWLVALGGKSRIVG